MVWSFASRNARKVIHVACAAAVAAGLAGLGVPMSAPAYAADAAKKDAGSEQKSSWIKLCQEVKEVNKKICLTQHEQLNPNTGGPLISVAVRQIEGQERDELLVIVPLGMMIPAGVQMTVDDKRVIKLRYSLCHAAGCTAEAPMTDEYMKMFKEGTKITVEAIDYRQRRVKFPEVPLTGFTKAYQGDPIDSQKYLEARRNVIEQLRKRAIALQKKAAAAEQKKKSSGEGEAKAQ